MLDGVVVGSATVAPYRVGWDAAGVAAGQHRLVAVAHGVDGATATSAAVIVTSDATPRYTVEASAYPSLAEAVAALPAGGGSVQSRWPSPGGKSPGAPFMTAGPTAGETHARRNGCIPWPSHLR